MPRFRAGAFDKGSRTKGRYTVVESANQATAMLDARKFFPGMPIARFFAVPAESFDKVDNNLHHFTNPRKKDTAR